MINNGKNDLQVDFLDTGAMAARIVEAINNQAAFKPLRVEAQKCVRERYSLADGERAFRRLLVAGDK